ncbi:hypothetical protein GCM10010978_29520 [Compostibacillus humi]|uniref:Permuted papain-like amidase YaeF/Yiix C92 family enzyme n=1 Tax=Compostibacillus humi TaxID=1245525 RepID=A0A8J2TQU5_9BACI|nr:hypothetical protein [Compostibacillus humi]GFZ87854.1 hypothetical protein GCM10010978_29520 [Compostibacillus humi]HLT55086.1 hypothetical protein [Bacillota bacterium]
MKNKKIYILLTDTKTVLGRIIKLYTKKPYSHASIAFDLELDEVYSFGRKMPSNPFIGGFVRENITSKLFLNARCAIYSCEVSETELQRMYQFIQKIEREKHRYRYNFLGLLSFIFDKNVVRENAFFCSQFVATVLTEGGVVTYKKPLDRITPDDLLDTEKFELIYEGNLQHYRNINIEPQSVLNIV